MLSYQHIYHAGNRADIHKHGILAAVLEILCRKDRLLTYMETHAGRGLYDLHAPESLKTGEAAEGWQALAREKAALAALPPGLTRAVRALNNGADGPLYPGSPKVAAHLLRPQDRLILMELHPQEHAALARAFKTDRRAAVHKREGCKGALALSPPAPRRGLVLVDPSYEIKAEYERLPAFLAALHAKWPEASIFLWYPLLPAARHTAMLEALAALIPGACRHEHVWAEPGQERGLYGSGMAAVNLPFGLEGFTGLRG